MNPLVFLRNIAMTGIASLGTIIQGFLLLTILTKFLDIESYGLWVQINITKDLLIVLASFQLNNGIVRFFSGVTNKKIIAKGFYSIVLFVIIINFIICSFFLLLSGNISGYFFGGLAHLNFVLSICVILPFAALNVICLSLYLSIHEISRFAELSLIQIIITIAFISLSTFFGAGLLGVLIAYILANVVFFILIMFSIYNKLGFESPDMFSVKPYVTYCLPLIPSVLLTWVVEISDRYLIAYFLGLAPVAIYSTAYFFGKMTILFFAPIGTVLLPTISNLHDNQRVSDSNFYLSNSFRLFLLLAIPSFFGVTVLAKSLLIAFSSDDYTSGYLIVPIIGLGSIFYASAGFCSIILYVANKTKLFFYLGILGATINLILNITLIPKIGIMGSAIASLVTLLFISIALFSISFRFISFSIDAIFILKCILSSLPLVIILRALNPVGSAYIACSIGLSALIYFIFIILLGGFSKQELEFIKDLFKISRSSQ